MLQLYSIGEVAQMLQVKPWKITFLYTSGKLPEPARFAGMRAFTKEDIEKISNLLKAKEEKNEAKC